MAYVRTYAPENKLKEHHKEEYIISTLLILLSIIIINICALH